MGPVAEKAVLKYYFHNDGGVREKARVLAQGYGTKDAVIFAQATEDVRQGAQRDTRAIPLIAPRTYIFPQY